VPVYHCPLCPLVFEYRTEVEWHLREEHRSRADEEADLRAELAAASAPLDWNRLCALRSSKGHPSVSLLLSTVPSATMTPLDIARLRQLAERARRRLSAEPDHDIRNSLVEHRLAQAVSTAETLSTERGLALLVNPNDLVILRLAFAPRDREVVDDRFATRDLEYDLRRYPHYRALVLGRNARILEGRAQDLSEPPGKPIRGPSRTPADDTYVEQSDAEGLLTDRVAAAGRLPLVVLGDQRRIEQFRRDSCHFADVIAEVTRPRLRNVPVVDLAAPAVDRWLSDHERNSIQELREADRQDEVAWGVEAAWSALETRKADRLWVEHDYHTPGRVIPGVSGVQRTNDPAEPCVIDDLVDALIAKASELGVTVDLLDAGALQRIEPVAARMPLEASKAIPEANTPSLAVT